MRLLEKRLREAGHQVSRLDESYVDDAADPDGTTVHFHGPVRSSGEHAADTGRRPIKAWCDEIRVEWQILEGRQPFYHRNCDVDEISYQISGERALMTELGVLDHRPGDYLSLLSHRELPQIAETSRIADTYTPERLGAFKHLPTTVSHEAAGTLTDAIKAVDVIQHRVDKPMWMTVVNP